MSSIPKDLFKPEFRIVTDNYCGYEVQHRYPLWPFWMQTGFVNTHFSIKQAKEYIDQKRSKVVWKEGDL